ncbi:MAG TPA: MFS transporter [Vicinamibacterales bacterium]|nr:MFS transporter [Vicinamibacterales bacterium]
MRASSPDLTIAEQRAVIARVTRRLIAFAFLCYVVAYVDRVNIGFAASALQRDLRLSDTAYGLGGGLFFLGYCLFEIPSNLVLERVGARLWIARIMIVWGLVSMATMFVTSTATFYAARVILGIAEAGFFPGMVLYFTYWIPASERARTGALFMMAAPISVIVGAQVSEALLALDGRGGLSGWQWLFLVEGAPAVVLGLLALRVLTDRPEQATWLPDREREWLAAHMAEERRARAAIGERAVFGSLRSPKVWLLATVYFLNTLVTYGVFLWLPKILRDLSGRGGWRLSAMTAIPFVAALIGMVVIGRHSDRTHERKRHVAACALTAATGLVLAACFTGDLTLLILSFTLSQIGQRSVMSVFWAIPPIVLAGTGAAAGIGLINAIGNLGGFVGPWAMGSLRDATGGYGGGFLVLAFALVVAAALVMSIKLPSAPPTR